jgi:hypothetical protein
MDQTVPMSVLLKNCHVIILSDKLREIAVIALSSLKNLVLSCGAHGTAKQSLTNSDRLGSWNTAINWVHLHSDFYVKTSYT